MTGEIVQEDDIDDLQPCTSQQSNQSYTLTDDSIVTKQVSDESIHCTNCKKNKSIKAHLRKYGVEMIGYVKCVCVRSLNQYNAAYVKS